MSEDWTMCATMYTFSSCKSARTGFCTYYSLKLRRVRILPLQLLPRQQWHSVKRQLLKMGRKRRLSCSSFWVAALLWSELTASKNWNVKPTHVMYKHVWGPSHCNCCVGFCIKELMGQERKDACSGKIAPSFFFLSFHCSACFSISCTHFGWSLQRKTGSSHTSCQTFLTLWQNCAFHKCHCECWSEENSVSTIKQIAVKCTYSALARVRILHSVSRTRTL